MNTDGIDFVANSGVYPPSDDTYLLVETITLSKIDSFLEVGCGVGLVTAAAARQAKTVVATDISLDAVRNTKENLERNGLHHKVSVFQGDLLTAVRAKSSFEVIAFNPPYLPEDGHTSNSDQATIGGPEGTEISEQFLSQAVTHLKSGGRVYLVCSTLADVSKIQRVMESAGLRVRISASKKLFYEELHILEGTFPKNHTETVL